MRIFYASHELPNQALVGSRVWRNNLYLALVDLGHDVVEFDGDLMPLLRHADPRVPGNREFVERHRPPVEALLLEQIEAAHRQAPIDLFFSYFYSVCARPETIRRIGAMGIRTMNWYCNASYQFDLVAEIAPAYDWCLVPEKSRLDDYRRIGAHPIYCQEAANPLVYRPVAVPRDLDVVFIGARYGERPAYLRRLVDAGIPVKVFGPGWRSRPSRPGKARRTAGEGAWARWRRRLTGLRRAQGRSAAARRLAHLLGRRATEEPPTALSHPTPVASPLRTADPSQVALPPEVIGGILSDDDMVATYSRAKISLGFSSVGNTAFGPERIVQVRLRDFEAPMSGSFYLAEDVPELGEFFVVGSEIAAYSGPEDLVAKCRYYLAHDDERERIRLAGHRRALADHTWQKRFETVFEQVGLPTRGSHRPRAAAGQ